MHLQYRENLFSQSLVGKAPVKLKDPNNMDHWHWDLGILLPLPKRSNASLFYVVHQKLNATVNTQTVGLDLTVPG